ncbi:hypothetical protein BSNK01_06350 [Bacillaceae bacterium]
MEDAERPDGGTFIKMEREELNASQDLFTDALLAQYPDLPESSIVVAVEASKHQLSRVREIMEQNGVSKILQD